MVGTVALNFALLVVVEVAVLVVVVVVVVVIVAFVVVVVTGVGVGVGLTADVRSIVFVVLLLTRIVVVVGRRRRRRNVDFVLLRIICRPETDGASMLLHWMLQHRRVSGARRSKRVWGLHGLGPSCRELQRRLGQSA